MLHAMLVGIQATWTVGLLLGAALLMANNPRPGQPPLSFARLFRLLLTVLRVTAGCAVLGGVLGYLGVFDHCTEDFHMIVRENLFRPAHFMATWGVHLGGYVGGVVGGGHAVVRIRRERWLLLLRR